MSQLLELAQDIQGTQAQISELENAISAVSPTPSIFAALASLKKREDALEEQFQKVTLDTHLDVCSYRLFYDDEEYTKPSLRSFTKTLFDFQTLFSQIYSAIKSGAPRNTMHLSAEIAQETAFGVNYTFTGSLGVVLTLPNERVLFGETEIDEAIRTIFELVKLEDSDKIAVYAKKLGVATIRALYDWTSDQVNAGLGSQIQWKRGEDVRLEATAQFPQLIRLKETIESSSEEEVTELDLFGILVGVDIPTRTFHMSFESGGDIRGKFDDALSKIHFELPKLYKAKIIKTRVVSYSTEKETVSYFLQTLE